MATSALQSTADQKLFGHIIHASTHDLEIGGELHSQTRRSTKPLRISRRPRVNRRGNSEPFFPFLFWLNRLVFFVCVEKSIMPNSQHEFSG
ncbi:hypothetical protein GQ457_04G004770 [Hibiscus cannabinus]